MANIYRLGEAGEVLLRRAKTTIAHRRRMAAPPVPSHGNRKQAKKIAYKAWKRFLRRANPSEEQQQAVLRLFIDKQRALERIPTIPASEFSGKDRLAFQREYEESLDDELFAEAAEFLSDEQVAALRMSMPIPHILLFRNPVKLASDANSDR